MFARAPRPLRMSPQIPHASDLPETPSLAEVAARLSSPSRPIVFRNDNATDSPGEFSDHDDGSVERAHSIGDSARGSEDDISEEEGYEDSQDDEIEDADHAGDGEGYYDEEEDEDDEESSSAHASLKGLREISSLGSWTVSSHKPGCGVASLRHPSTAQYWQSDGPQPHSVTLHFIKKVEVVRLRVYLDFEVDESYTPTRMSFLAGMGGNDFVEFATWQGETPRGWVDISLDGVGGYLDHKSDRLREKRWWRSKKGRKSEDENMQDHNYPQQGAIIPPDEYSSNDGDDFHDGLDSTENKPPTGNVLKAMVIQMRVLENHQNGKDTHVRGFQVFARDDRHAIQSRGEHAKNATSRTSKAQARQEILSLDETDWMPEPEIR